MTAYGPIYKCIKRFVSVICARRAHDKSKVGGGHVPLCAPWCRRLWHCLRCGCSSPSCTVVRCYLPSGRCWRRAMSEVWMSSPSCTVVRCYLPLGKCWRRAMSCTVVLCAADIDTVTRVALTHRCLLAERCEHQLNTP